MRRSDLSSFLTADATILRQRRQWRFRGEERPSFAAAPKPGQESVWDYPRPPRIAADRRRIEIRHRDEVLASTTHALRVLETASPPTFYLPPEDVRVERFVENGRKSMCEWKGMAVEFDLLEGPSAAAWCYRDVFPEFESIAGWFAFYAARLDCRVDGERVRPQPGGYYGGWLTNEIVGPVKGEKGCDGL